MQRSYSSKNSIKEFKRKRKTSIKPYRFDDNIIDEDVKPLKRFMTEEDYDNFTDSSNSTTPLYNSKIPEYETSTNGGLSSDESEFKDSCYSYNSKSKQKINGSIFQSKSEKLDYCTNQSGSRASERSITASEDYLPNEQDTFRVDMGRFRCYTSSSHNNNFLHSDFRTSIESPVFKFQSSSTPPRLQNQRKNRSHIYKPHRHNKSVTVTHVPCKGPACTSQICCAHFCSQRCYDNQKPIGSGSNFKTSIQDYDNCGPQEINVTDYGLPYPDHTYCRDHKDIYFNADPQVDEPPYADLIESIFFEEKESRIKNPVPIPNCNGDPISSNGYTSQITKRGRPKRSNVVGLLNPYIFHPSSEVIYTPFIFKESIVEADRLSRDLESCDPIVNALRQCSNLYKDVRSDIPREVLYGNNSNDNQDLFDKIKRECRDEIPSLIDDLLGPVADDFAFK